MIISSSNRKSNCRALCCGTASQPRRRRSAAGRTPARCGCAPQASRRTAPRREPLTFSPVPEREQDLCVGHCLGGQALDEPQAFHQEQRCVNHNLDGLGCFLSADPTTAGTRTRASSSGRTRTRSRRATTRRREARRGVRTACPR